MTTATTHRLGVSTGRPEAWSAAIAACSRATESAAALGLALQHVTEPLRVYVRPHPADLFVATTMVTKQIRAALQSGQVEERLVELLLDAHRPALADGTTAQSLFARSWTDFEHDSMARLGSTLAFARSEGPAALLRLSAWYARADPDSWWGVSSWEARIDRLVLTGRIPTSLAKVLRARPEIVDHLTLCRVLSSGHGEHAPGRGLAHTAA